MGLADIAERSLDLQYYIWEGDSTGKVLIAKIIAAADRGVRILLDNNFQGRDFGLGAIDEHPNIEVRVFNPFANLGMHAFDFMTSFNRVNGYEKYRKQLLESGVEVYELRPDAGKVRSHGARTARRQSRARGRGCRLSR